MSDLFPFTASNGVRVVPMPELLRFRTYGAASWEDFETAVSEYTLAKRDAELGRWRSKEHPEYVVYRRANRSANVLNERTCSVVLFRDHPALAMNCTEDAHVAREFFAAHPEPRPWHNAKPGEVWLLGVIGCESGAYLVDSTGEFYGTVTRNPRSDSIKTGRRIWPEGGNE